MMIFVHTETSESERSMFQFKKDGWFNITLMEDVNLTWGFVVHATVTFTMPNWTVVQI